MPGKPHKTSFPEESFSSKTALVWIVNGRVLIRPLVFTASATAKLFRWPKIAPIAAVTYFFIKQYFSVVFR